MVFTKNDLPSQINYGSFFLFVIEKGDPIVSTLTYAMSKLPIRSASISGIGAVQDPEIGYFKTETKTYQTKIFHGLFEIASLYGNISFKQNELMAHLHIVISDETFSTKAGHFIDGIVGVTTELCIWPEQYPAIREYNSEFNLFFLKS